MAKELIAAQTAAADSAVFSVGSEYLGQGVCVWSEGLAGAETIDVQQKDYGAATYADLYENGSQIQLTTTNTRIRLVGPGQYRLSKGVTAGAVGAYLSTAHDL